MFHVLFYHPMRQTHVIVHTGLTAATAAAPIQYDEHCDDTLFSPVGGSKDGRTAH